MARDVIKFLEHPDSGAQVFQTMENIILERKQRPAPPKGHAYKRDFIDNAIADGTLNFTFIKENLEPVLLGSAKLTLSQRDMIKYVVNRACDDFYRNRMLKTKAKKIFKKASTIFKSI